MKKHRTDRAHQPDYVPGRAALIWAGIQQRRRQQHRPTNTTRRQEDQQ